MPSEAYVAFSFPYNAQLVEQVKAIPNRRYDKNGRRWLVPKAYADQVRQLIAEFQNPQAYATITKPTEWHFKTQPWPHQLLGVEYAFPRPAVLLDCGMGVGKTKIAIDTVFQRQHKSILVTCPKSVVPVWLQQLERHAPGPYVFAALDTGSVPKNLTLAKITLIQGQEQGLPCFLITNHEAVWREPFGAWAMMQRWDCLIADECHRLKSPSGRASRFMYRLGFRATQRLGLSGTPLPHSPMDAYGVYRVLDPTIFGTNYVKFRDQYAVIVNYGGFPQIVDYKNTAEFRKKFDTIRYHVSRDVLDLPEAHHIDIPVPLPEAAAVLYRRLEKDFYAKVGTGEISVANALVKLLRLQQLTSGHLPLDDDDETGEKGEIREIHTAKADALSDILADTDPEEPFVVFCRFRKDLEAVCRVACSAGRQYYELSGSHKELEQWKAAEHGAVLGTQIGAGSEGIDLTKARYCVFFSISLSLSQFDQAVARLHRPGQTRTVAYMHLVCPSTVDTEAYRALSERRDVIEAIIGKKITSTLEGIET